MRTFITVVLIGLFAFWSCDTPRSITKEVSPVIPLNVSTGGNDTFELGRITYLENSDCTYIIIDEKTTNKFDPINFMSAEYLQYKKNNLLIYYKYRPLRMVNRCYNIQPIELVAIEKRED